MIIIMQRWILRGPVAKRCFSYGTPAWLNRQRTDNIQIVSSKQHQPSATSQNGQTKEDDFKYVSRNMVYQSDLDSYISTFKYIAYATPLIAPAILTHSIYSDDMFLTGPVFSALVGITLLPGAVGYHMTKNHVSTIEVLSKTGSRSGAHSSHGTFFPPDVYLRFTFNAPFKRNGDRAVICKVGDIRYHPRFFNRIWTAETIDGEKVDLYMDTFMLKNDPIVLLPLWKQALAQTGYASMDRIGVMTRLMYSADIETKEAMDVGKDLVMIEKKNKENEKTEKQRMKRFMMLAAAVTMVHLAKLLYENYYQPKDENDSSSLKSKGQRTFDELRDLYEKKE